MLQRRSICVVTMGVMLLVALRVPGGRRSLAAADHAFRPGVVARRANRREERRRPTSLNTRSFTRRSTTRNASRCR